MKRVLHLIETSGPGGAEKMLLNHITQLRQLGIESDVILLRDGWLKKQVEATGSGCLVIPLNRFLSPSWLGKVTRLIKKNGYDALHSHEFAMNCHSAVLSLLCKAPAIATVHGKNYYSERLQRRILYRTMSKIGHFVAVSDDIAEFLSSKTGAPRSRLTVIPNGIDIKKFARNLAARRKIRAEFQVTDQDVLVGAVGNLYPVKGHIYLVRAAAKVVAAFKNIKFVVAGRGAEQELLQQEIDSLGLDAHFKLLGFREDIPELLQGFDIFAMPSLSEGLPLSILEAMSAKCVVMASHVGGIPELIHDGLNGILTPPANPDAIAEKLLGLISNPAQRAAITATAYDIICEKYSQEMCTAAYVDLYKKFA